MAFNAGTYNPTQTIIHAIDPRVKIALMFVYSISLFLVESWIGMGIMLLIAGISAMLARIQLLRTLKQFSSLGIILLFTVLANSISFYGIESATFVQGCVMDTLLSLETIHLFGNGYFSIAGFATGIFLSLRIILLVFASIVLTTTTSVSEIVQSFEQALRPLDRVGIPSRDVSTAISIAMRFIPETINEFQIVHAAQLSRGARFYQGSLKDRTMAWGNVLIPLFVGLFRRASVLSIAMDSRCYGIGRPSCMRSMHCSASSWAVLVIFTLICVATAITF